MPVNKDAMARYRIIDRMLADPHKDYTTKDIEKAVARECPKVTTRMIQKDIKALEEAPFSKKMLRGMGGRGTVRYEDQSTPLFYQEITADEEEILREAKPNQRDQIRLGYDRVRRYLPEGVPPEKAEAYILRALEFYGRHMEQERSGGAR